MRTPIGGGDGDGEDVHHDVVALPAWKLEELLRRVEAEERKAAARVEEVEAMRRASKARRAGPFGEAGRRTRQDSLCSAGGFCAASGCFCRAAAVRLVAAGRVAAACCWTLAAARCSLLLAAAAASTSRTV